MVRTRLTGSDRTAYAIADNRLTELGGWKTELADVLASLRSDEDIDELLTGFTDPPSDKEMAEGMSYNVYFPGGQIAMAPPLSEDIVEYEDKTKATAPQMARDVTTFLAWAAEPELEERKRMGVKVVLFLIVLTGLLYAIKRRVWNGLH